MWKKFNGAKYLFFPVIIQLMASGCFSQESIPSLKDSEPLFEKVLSEWHGAGVAIAVVYKDRIIYKNAFGYRDYEKKLPVTTQTLFPIGSCTKLFTSSLIGMLYQLHKVDLDKPVRTYFPGLKFYNDEMDKKITLRNMMSHTSGLPRHDYSWYFFPVETSYDLVDRFKYLQPATSPNLKWQYNNFMYALQGFIVQKITLQTWEDNICKKIFLPLEMVHSCFDSAGISNAGNVAKGYELKNGLTISGTGYHNLKKMSPAGGINSSVEELSSWLITWLNEGRYKNTQIIPPQFYYESLSSQAVVSPGFPSPAKPDLFFTNYGLGWMLSSYRGHYRAEHNGTIDGFSATLCIFPTDSIGIVVLTNQDNSQIQNVIRNIIADKLLSLPPYNWNGDLKKFSEFNTRMKSQMISTTRQKILTGDFSTKLKSMDYAGSYYNKGYGKIVITFSHDSLYALVGTRLWCLQHIQGSIFEPRVWDSPNKDNTDELSQFIFKFEKDAKGKIKGVSVPFEPDIKPVFFNKEIK